jgi:hypothetical protein
LLKNQVEKTKPIYPQRGRKLACLKKPLLLGGRKSEESRGYKIVNTYNYFIELIWRISIVVITYFYKKPLFHGGEGLLKQGLER